MRLGSILKKTQTNSAPILHTTGAGGAGAGDRYLRFSMTAPVLVSEKRWANTPRRRSGSIAKLRNQSDLACLFLAMQELDLCIADCKLGFVWLDEPQEMQLA
jgi:hypothetical protein